MTLSTLPAGPGVELSYMDSGPPSINSLSYITIVAIHGMAITNMIFQRLGSAAHNKGVRVIAPSRRGYPGSTAFTPEEQNVLFNGGTDEEKDAYIQARGHEIAIFIDNLIQKFSLPPISKDGKDGGIVLLGWSIGVSTTLAAISGSPTLPSTVQARLGSYLRSLILYDPAPIVIGLPTPVQNWTPLLDTYIPENLRIPAFGHWVTFYFDHGDISNRDLNTLSWVLGSTSRIPTIYNIPASQLTGIEAFGSDGFSDLPYMVTFLNQTLASYRKSLYDPETLKIFPKMKTTLMFGQSSGAFAIAGMWAVQDDAKELGIQTPPIKLIPDINHFWHWDDPEMALEEFMLLA